MHLVQQALDAGHEVVALVRTPSKFTIHHDRLKVVQGDVLNDTSVEQTIQGVDVVVSVLGPTDNKPTFSISQGTAHILNAMTKHNVRRFIVSVGAGVRDAKDKPKLIDRFFGLLLNVLSKNAFADMQRAIDLVRQSDRDWIVVRVPRLNNEPAQNTLKIGYVGEIDTRISRADMAAFMLKQLTDKTYVGKAPAISN